MDKYGGEACYYFSDTYIKSMRMCYNICIINMNQIQRFLFLSLMDGILLLGAVGIRSEICLTL